MSTILNVPYFIDNALKTINSTDTDCQSKLINDWILAVQSFCVFVIISTRPTPRVPYCR
jgi:hypothetical protein